MQPNVDLLCKEVCASNTQHCCASFRAGMQPGDVVLEINGVKVNTAEEVYQAVNSGDKITMVVQRGEELFRLQVIPEFTE